MGQMNAAYYREYRRRNADRLREYNRLRRQQPKLKAQRYAAENRRRARRVPVYTPEATHRLLDQAARLLPERPHLLMLKSQDEAMWEDARSEAVLALLERRDPTEAIRAYRNRELEWQHKTSPLIAWPDSMES
jgi:hypothetical protein